MSLSTFPESLLLRAEILVKSMALELAPRWRCGIGRVNLCFNEYNLPPARKIPREDATSFAICKTPFRAKLQLFSPAFLYLGSNFRAIFGFTGSEASWDFLLGASTSAKVAILSCNLWREVWSTNASKGRLMCISVQISCPCKLEAPRVALSVPKRWCCNLKP